MSVRVMSLVWGIDLPDSEKLVLLALADSANDEGHCWPSMKTLAKKCSKTDRTVQASIKSLVASGHLTRSEVPGKGCNYIVHPRSGFTPEVVSPRRDCPPKRTTLTPEAVSDKPSRTIISEESERARAILSSPEWKAFAAMRRQIKKPLNPTAERRLLARLNRQRWIDRCGFHGPADRWSAEAVALAFELRAKGWSYGEIALAVSRTPDAVAARLRGGPKVSQPRTGGKPKDTWGMMEERNRRTLTEIENDRFVEALHRAEMPPQTTSNQPLTFEQKLARVAAGAALVEVRPFNRRGDPAYSLTGCAAGMVAL